MRSNSAKQARAGSLGRRESQSDRVIQLGSERKKPNPQHFKIDSQNSRVSDTIPAAWGWPRPSAPSSSFPPRRLPRLLSLRIPIELQLTQRNTGWQGGAVRFTLTSVGMCAHGWLTCDTRLSARHISCKKGGDNPDGMQSILHKVDRHALTVSKHVTAPHTKRNITHTSVSTSFVDFESFGSRTAENAII